MHALGIQRQAVARAANVGKGTVSSVFSGRDKSRHVIATAKRLIAEAGGKL